MSAGPRRVAVQVSRDVLEGKADIPGGAESIRVMSSDCSLFPREDG